MKIDTWRLSVLVLTSTSGPSFAFAASLMEWTCCISRSQYNRSSDFLLFATSDNCDKLDSNGGLESGRFICFNNLCFKMLLNINPTWTFSCSWHKTLCFGRAQRCDREINRGNEYQSYEKTSSLKNNLSLKILTNQPLLPFSGWANSNVDMLFSRNNDVQS